MAEMDPRLIQTLQRLSREYFADHWDEIEEDGTPLDDEFVEWCATWDWSAALEERDIICLELDEVAADLGWEPRRLATEIGQALAGREAVAGHIVQLNDEPWVITSLSLFVEENDVETEEAGPGVIIPNAEALDWETVSLMPLEELTEALEEEGEE
jgi:hypothetical protein